MSERGTPEQIRAKAIGVHAMGFVGSVLVGIATHGVLGWRAVLLVLGVFFIVVAAVEHGPVPWPPPPKETEG